MTSPFTMTAEAESPGTGLSVPLGDPKQIFRLGGSLPFIAAVREHVGGLKPQLDVSTKEGRQFIASTAYKIARTKTFAYAKAKELSAVYKAMAKEIDSEADEMGKALDKLKHETRQPLTDWEERDSARNAEFETKLGEIFDACLFVGAPTPNAVKDRMAKLMEYQRIEWAEFSQRATDAFAQTIPALREMLTRAQEAEADRLELEELRALRASQPRPSEFTPLAFAAWEAAQPKPTTITNLVIGVEGEAMNDLCEIIDIDQAADVLAAIKAGKIRHVQIIY